LLVVSSETMTWVEPSSSTNHSGAQVRARPAVGKVWLATNCQFRRSLLRANPMVCPVQLVV
jgi:hypothetical protein